MRWSGAGETRTDGPGGSVPADGPAARSRRGPRPRAGAVGRGARRARARPATHMGEHHHRLAGTAAELRHQHRPTRRPTLLRGAAGPDARLGRNGRRDDRRTPRTRRPRPQLRLPLRVDPRPMLRRTGRRRRRAAPATGRRRAVRQRTAARRTAPTSPPPTPSTASKSRPSTTPVCPATRAAPACSATTYATQFQLDAFGEALLLYAAAARHDRLDTDHWRAATVAVSAIEQRWSGEGAGLWELQPRRWTHSRLICAAGLRQLAAAAAPTGDAARWNALADRILAETSMSGATSRPVAGSGRTTTNASTRRCCCRRYAAPYPPRTRERSRRCKRCAPSSRATATSTASAMTRGRSGTPKARSCSAASSWRWPNTSRATRSRPPAGSNATGPPADRRASSPRSTTSPNASCAATCLRPSSTP